MDKEQPQHDEDSQNQSGPRTFIETQQKQPQQSQQMMNSTYKPKFESQTSNKSQIQQSSKEQARIQTSFDKISIQSPFKKQTSSIQYKSFDKASFSLHKISQKKDVINQKPNKQAENEIMPKNIQQSTMKSTIKNNQKITKANKPFYQETFYITGMKQNYLLLLSDRNQVLEFPISMFTEHGGGDIDGNSEQKSQNENSDQFHLIKDIKIGQPIKIKLQFDFFRQQKDEKLFNSLQKKINEEYRDKEEGSIEIRKREKSFKKTNTKFS